MVREIENLTERIKQEYDVELGYYVLPGPMYTLLKEEMNTWYAQEKRAGRKPTSTEFRATAEALAQNFVSLRPNESAKTIASKLIAKLDDDRREAKKVANQIEETQKNEIEEKKEKKTNREKVKALLSNQTYLLL